MFSKNELISVSSTNYIERNVTKHMTNVHIWAFLVRKCKDPPFPGNCSNVKEMQPPLMPFCGYPYYLLLLRCFGILGCLLNTWFFFFFFSLSILQPKKGKFCHSYWSQAEGISFSRTLPRQLFSQGGLSFFLSCFLLGFHLCSLL